MTEPQKPDKTIKSVSSPWHNLAMNLEGPEIIRKPQSNDHIPSDWICPDLTETPGDPSWQEMVCQYKESIKRKYEHRNESSFSSSERVSLAALYTEPVIIQKNKKGRFQNVNVEEFILEFNKSGMYYPASVILQGNSGSGKSFISQKIILDWASGNPYLRNFNLVFYLRCEELKCISAKMNLIELLSWNCGLSSDQISKMLQYSSHRVLFIIDGFDDLRFMHCELCISSKFQRAPPEVIVYSILSKQILPRCVLLITTRSEVPQGMLLKRHQRFTEIGGFSEKGVKEYFQKFFQNEELFRKAYECVRVNETLFTACSIPVICSIICTVMRERFSDGADVTSGLETTTSIYLDFVSTLLESHCQGLSQSVPSLLRSLGQLAERGMLEQQVLFDEKTVYDTISDSADKPFLLKFLLRRKIHQETMFGFMHFSFQEFFTALYYVLLDEKESQRKVRELLHTVERAWALSCWSERDFSKADVEVRHANLLQPVILFLCGLCKKERISSFFEKHNMTLSINIEIQLKEWIHQCSQIYHNEHMLFILHCLYELHEKSFVGKVLEHLVLIDRFNMPLKSTDGWVLKYGLKCCEHIRTLKVESSDSQLKQSSEHAEEFKPEHVQRDDEDKRKNTYRFVCPHAGQFKCCLTSLVFVMASEGEVLYRVVSWNPGLLNGLGQMKPAGPLYNIDCFNGSVSGLHLPHCEIFCEENKDSLAVAHFTSGNVEIMNPLKVTESHVIIDIRDLSHFGILKRIFPPSPVIAQVLLFLRPITVKQSENILDVHLLPWNVPLSKVKDQHTENTHIKTSSKCSLIPESEYHLCCQPEESTVQPASETFECNYGPNYHPTFEVFVDVNKEEIVLSLLDKTEREVWERRRIPLTAVPKSTANLPGVPKNTARITSSEVGELRAKRLTECEFVKKHRDVLIRRVSSVMTIADGLKTKDMIPDEIYSKVHALEPRQEKTRLLLDALHSGGDTVITEFYKLLKNEEPHLVDELMSGPSRPQQI